ncbi:hypothetical protein CRUP_004680 [Coryphaenoides rupestris]|nr:hypothetical protein CRUP_004680 [Coryphaenoides rupestris]
MVVVTVASLGVTTFTLCALCIDRFRAATNVQMYYEMIENCTSTTAKLAVIWVGALLLALPELLIRQLVVVETAGPASVLDDDGGGGGDHRGGELPTGAASIIEERCVIRISTQLPDTLYVLGLTYQGARLWWCFGCYFCLPTLFTIGCSLVTARKIRRAGAIASGGGAGDCGRLGGGGGGCGGGGKQEADPPGEPDELHGGGAGHRVRRNICNIAAAYMAAGVPERAMAALHFLAQLLLFCRAAVTPALLLLLCRPLGRAFLDCCCCCCCGYGGLAPRNAPPSSSAAGSDDNEHECTTELELSPFSTIRRELSNYTPPAANANANAANANSNMAAATGGSNC